MSALSLKPKGIYRIETDGKGGWVYVRREGKVRSRLFLVKDARDGGVGKAEKEEEIAGS